MHLLLALGLFLTSAQAAVVRTVPGSNNYTVVGLTAAKDVFFSTCDNSKYPAVACDEAGTATWLIQKDLFESKLKEALKYDSLSKKLGEDITYTQNNVASHQASVKEAEAGIASTNSELKRLNAHLQLVEKQIADAEERLKDPNLSPNDRKELEGFVEKSKQDRVATLDAIGLKKSALRELEKTKQIYLTELSRSNAKLAHLQKDQKARVAEIAQKTSELLANLNSSEATITYLNETLFFLSGLVFTEPGLVPDSDCKVTGFSVLDGLGKARGTFHLKKGIFPLVAKAGFRNFQSEFEAEISAEYTDPDTNWVRDEQGVFSFVSPRTNKRILCEHNQSKVPGREPSFYDFNKVTNGFKANLYYAGRYTGDQARAICMGLSKGSANHNDMEYIFGAQFRYDQFFPGLAHELMNFLGRRPIVKNTWVENTPPLENGYYAWAGDSGKHLFRFSEEYGRPEVVSVPESLRSVPLPTICTETVF